MPSEKDDAPVGPGEREPSAPDDAAIREAGEAPPAGLPAGSTGAGVEIIVDEDGRVIFTDLPPELQAIVDELDPDSPRSQVCLVPGGSEE